MRAIMSQEMMSIVFMWYLAHRLESALKSALKDDFFESVNKILLNLHLLYYKSQQKLRELKEVHDLLKELRV